MLWIFMLFTVGLCGAIGFYDKVFGFSDLMRYINSGILVLLSMGLLIRTWILSKHGKVERLQARVNELEKMLEQSGHTADVQPQETVNQPY